jgi:molybdopterin synthase catalytic subunit
VTEVIASISDSPLDVTGAVGAASTPGSGGIAMFIGTVRESAAVAGNDDKPVVRLEYEAHPTLAPARMREIAEEAARRWNLERTVAIHRTGPCELGEPTVVIACSAAHRTEALDACRHIIDTIKESVPIWKREVYADGSSWVGAEGTP